MSEKGPGRHVAVYECFRGLPLDLGQVLAFLSRAGDCLELRYVRGRLGAGLELSEGRKYRLTIEDVTDAESPPEEGRKI